MTERNDRLREIVREKYAEIARAKGSAQAPSCCDSTPEDPAGLNLIGDAYEGVSGYLAEADLGLGCGLPVEHAGLSPGQTVLDLGSGAGLDLFVARSEVSAEGRLIGVDMTPEMVAQGRDNARRCGFENVEFRLGEIENLPVASDSIDVVISNCVLNLVPDKPRAFAEIFRVLKAGGHFCISDVVASGQLPDWLGGIAAAYAGCVSGALPRDDYLKIIEDTGFERIEVADEKRIEVPEELVSSMLSGARQKEVLESELHVFSITIRAFKPATEFG